MELNWIMFAVVCPLVFLGSFIDAVAGGGGLVTLPAYLMVGLPAHMAVGTNKFSSGIGTAFSTIRYCKNGHCDWPLAVPGIIGAFVGAQIGAKIALLVSSDIFRILLLVLIPVLAIYTFLKKDLEPDPDAKISRTLQFVYVSVASLLIGLYDGFYGPGTGTFLILAYTGLVKMDVLTAGGNTKLANLTSNISALVVFLRSGVVLLPLGIAAAAFSIAGHTIGAGYAMKKGAGAVRYMILVVIGLLFVKVIMDAVM